MAFSLVAAVDAQWGIGRDGGLPWPKIKGDMRFFRDLTTCPDTTAVWAKYRMDIGFRDPKVYTWDGFVPLSGTAYMPSPSMDSPNAVVMGRKTWDSLPERFRPLPDRKNIVLTKTPGSFPEGVVTASSLPEAMRLGEGSPEIFVIGGGKVFAEAMEQPECRRIYLTRIEGEFAADTFLRLPENRFVETAASPWVEEKPWRYRFEMLERRN